MDTQATRRTIVTGLIGCSLGSTLWSTAQATAARTLAFRHTHTGRKLDILYSENGEYLTAALHKVDRFLKDFRTGDIHPIDPTLLDTLYQLGQQFDHEGQFQVISAYRSPRTNEQLRQHTSGVARKSYHMQGRAIDVRLTGTNISALHEAALNLRQGGVGYYPRSDFIHLDTGPVRRWGG